MKYIKQYEFFNLFNKEKKYEPKDWKDVLGVIKVEFDKLKKGQKESTLSADTSGIQKDLYMIHSVSYKGKFMISLVFYSRNGEYYLGNDSVVGKIKFKDREISISKSEFDELISIFNEISDWLDKDSESNFNKSGTSVGDNGDIDFGFDEVEIELDNINDKLSKKVFKPYLGKSFEFEITYNEWTGPGTNELKSDRYELPIEDIRLEITTGFDPSDKKSSFIYITTTFNGERMKIYFPSNKNPISYVDLVKNRTENSSKYLIMDPIEKEMTRRQKRELKRTYPYSNYYNLVPSKYNTIEFIKGLKDLLTMVDDGLNQKL